MSTILAAAHVSGEPDTFRLVEIEPEVACLNPNCDWIGLWHQAVESDESYHCPDCAEEVDE